MTIDEAREIIKQFRDRQGNSNDDVEALDMAIKALERQSIDKSAMMYEIYMEGVNMTGEYQGCWVRFKNIEKIVDKYMTESEGLDCGSN